MNLESVLPLIFFGVFVGLSGLFCGIGINNDFFKKQSLEKVE